MFIYLLGLALGRTPHGTALGLAAFSFFSCALFSGLLYGGHWLLTTALPFGQTTGENIVYWVVAGLSAIFMLPQIPSKLRTSWSYATRPGALDDAATTERTEGLLRQATLPEPEDWEQSR